MICIGTVTHTKSGARSFEATIQTESGDRVVEVDYDTRFVIGWDKNGPVLTDRKSSKDRVYERAIVYVWLNDSGIPVGWNSILAYNNAKEKYARENPTSYARTLSALSALRRKGVIVDRFI